MLALLALSSLFANCAGRRDLRVIGNVVLVVLRGFPGYQCPYCTRQVQEFVSASERFQKAGAEVVFIYPGPPDELTVKATESAAGKKLPGHFTMLLDPGCEFTNLCGLRWDAPKETAYPSTFLLKQKGEVFYAKIGKEHGGAHFGQ